MPRTLYLFATLCLGSSTLACSDDSGDGGGGGSGLSFAADVHPILVEKCGICHGAGTSEGADYPAHGSDDVQESLSEVMMDGLQGQKVYQRILVRTNPPNPVDIMPLACGTGLDDGTCLTTAEYETIEQWVAAGTPP